MQLRNTLLHLRPRSFPIVFAHFAAGAAVAIVQLPGEDRVAALLRALAGGVLWTICMNGATLALNSAFDRDEGDVGYLDNPPPVPPHLALFAVALMALGLFGSLAFSSAFFWAYFACALLSLAYSVPPVRLKAVAGADLVVNMIGYGALTFGAGAWAAASDSSAGSERGILYFSASFAFLFGAFYPMTQIYQVAEDTARGDRTLVVRLGILRSLQFSLLAIVIFGILQQLALHSMQRGALARGLLILPVAAWLAFTIHWIRNRANYPDQKGMYRALKLWALADVATIVACTV